MLNVPPVERNQTADRVVELALLSVFGKKIL